MSRRLLAKAIGVNEDQVSRGRPFFAVYLLLFSALTIGDAASVALFTSRVGAERLPVWYALTALGSLLLIGGYLTQVSKIDSGQMFFYILAATSGTWLIAWSVHSQVGTFAYGVLFVSREIALTMVLMHFGTFLQDYFTRAELNRILPAIYAGGRCGGIVGGFAVTMLSQRIGVIHLILLAIALLGGAAVAIGWIVRHTPTRDEPEPQREITAPKETATPWQTVRKFLQQVVRVPLLYWLTWTTLLFVLCRWMLMYQYTAGFEAYFANENALARFLGIYTQASLSISLLLQLFIVPRLVSRLGVAKSHFIYMTSVLFCLLSNLWTGGVVTATASRFVEAELRFGLRNPLNQMLVNRFPKKQRIAVRGWSLGWLIPCGTLLASGLITGLQVVGGPQAIAWAGCCGGVLLVVAGWKVGRAYNRYEAD